MKKNEIRIFSEAGKRKEILLKMKLTLLLLMVGLLQVAAVSYSQTTRLSIEANGKQVAEILREIEDKSEFRFFYQREQVTVERRVDIEVKDQTIEEILALLFPEDEIKYKIYADKLILLAPDEILAEANTALEAEIAIQPYTVTGVVTDDSGQPLPGVAIYLKDTTWGTITDLDGNYAISNVTADDVLVFSFVGMKSREVVVGDQTIINVTLEYDFIGIEEVVAIGYGSMVKSDMTGAVVRADLHGMAETQNMSVLSSLRGKVPGLDIGQTVKPGEEPDLLIRGKATFSGSQQPLIVLDGVIYRGSLNDINPNDIESLDVLKDASAAAVYGSQASNGVILITTTKGGNKGKPLISYTGSYAFKSPVKELKGPDIEGFHEQAETKNILYSRLPPDYLQPNPIWNMSDEFSTNEEVEAYQDGRTTNWYDILTNDEIYTQEHNLSMSNSTDVTNYLVSLGYRDETGYLVGDGYSRINGRINLSNKLTDWLNIGVQSFMSISDYSGNEANVNNRYIEPYATDTDADGNRYNTILAGQVNPYIQMERDEFNQTMTLFGNVFAEINIPFVRGLTYRINLANNYRRSREYYFAEYDTDFQGAGEKYISFEHDLSMDNIVTYKREFNDIHNINLTLVYGFEKNKQDESEASGEVFIDPILGYHNLEAAELQLVSSGAWEESSLYSMARLFYGFRNKYLLTGTVRRDGYSGFGENNKFGVFPSLSLAWRVSEESFTDNLSWLDQLKIRVSYGTVGNRTIGRYQTLATVDGGYTYINMQHESQYSQWIGSLSSPNLKWEKTTGLNLGVDFGVLSQRIFSTVEYYNNNTTDLFYYVDVPSVSRYSTYPDNLGKLNNEGLELSLTTVNIRNSGLEWITTFSYTRNRNKLVELLGFDNDGDGKEDDLVSEGLFIGESIDAIYDYEIDGLWQVDDEIPSGFDIGSYKIVDQNGDGVINPEDDKVILGNSEPAYTFDLQSTLRYKAWTLRFNIHSLQGGKNYYLGDDNYRSFYLDRNRWILPEDLDYWTPENPNTRYERPDVNVSEELEGTIWAPLNFVRLENVSLSYDLPGNIIQKIRLRKARVYFNGQNLLTLTKWNGWDPETNQAITKSGLPVLKSFTFGINIEF